MKKYNLVVSLTSVLLGCLVLYLSAALSGYDEHGVPGERYWPSAIAWLFIMLGALQALVAWRASEGDAGRLVDLRSPAVRKAYMAALIAAIYGLLLLCVGFVIATLAFIPAMMTLMGERRPWVGAVTAIVVVSVIYVFFAQIFNTTLPASIIFE